MTTMLADLASVPDHVMLDTNVLLAATDEGRDDHQRALVVLNQWPADGSTLYVSGQILREYLAVATRPASKNGLGMRAAEAVRNATALRERTTLLTEDVRVSDRLLSLLSDVTCAGRKVHDANIVATMLAHGVRTVVTANLDDFARFGRLVYLVGL